MDQLWLCRVHPRRPLRHQTTEPQLFPQIKKQQVQPTNPSLPPTRWKQLSQTSKAGSAKTSSLGWVRTTCKTKWCKRSSRRRNALPVKLKESLHMIQSPGIRLMKLASSMKQLLLSTKKNLNTQESNNWWAPVFMKTELLASLPKSWSRLDSRLPSRFWLLRVPVSQVQRDSPRNSFTVISHTSQTLHNLRERLVAKDRQKGMETQMSWIAHLLENSMSTQQ